MRRLIEIDTIDILMLQETLGSVEDIKHTLVALRPGWHHQALDAIARAGGLAISYNPRTINVSATWGSVGFIGMDLFSVELGETLRVINVYGPCQRREDFWQHFLGTNLTSVDQLIIGGDLDFSIGYGESWGLLAQIDPSPNFFRYILELHHLDDIPMNKSLLTWRNRRTREAALARRLDRFLIKIPLLQKLSKYRQWVGAGGKSDHSPIYLDILGPEVKPRAPFKFNHIWLQDEEYIKLIKDYWVSHPISNHRTAAEGFCHNLSKLKQITKTWAKEKKVKEDQKILDIESKLETMLDDRNLGFSSVEGKNRVIELEIQKDKILKEREENYAKGRKVSNTIWKLPLPNGESANNFQKLSRLGTSHFRNLFRAPQEVNLADIIHVAGLFPRYVGEEEANKLNVPVTLEELEGILKWFKNDKSSGPDGWPIDFYSAFYNFMVVDLLQVIEEFRSTGWMYNAINTTFIALIPKNDSPGSFDEFRPISLCNCLYKIISKIIANRIRPILSRCILPEQFSFLEDRQILEAIGSAQEAIHSIRARRLKGIILKIDLAKAFDRVDWTYIKILLII
eukprot:PITA_18044